MNLIQELKDVRAGLNHGCRHAKDSNDGNAMSWAAWKLQMLIEELEKKPEPAPKKKRTRKKKAEEVAS